MTSHCRDLPLVCDIATGGRLLAELNVKEYLAVPRSQWGSGEGGEEFLLSVKGDSLANARILDGDLVVTPPGGAERRDRRRCAIAAKTVGRLRRRRSSSTTPSRGKLSPHRRGVQFGTRSSIASVTSTNADDRAAFWRQYQPGMRSTEAEVGTPEFFAGVEAIRYRQEPHIAELVGFENWASADVLEVGCGIGTDGVRFASAGASYTGIDFSDVALDLARRQFELNGLSGQFLQVSLPNLPFADDSFDLVYSFGVLHHIPETDAAVAEIYRILRPGGHALVMLYNRHSVNYYVTIMTLRRLLAAVLLIPHGAEVVGRVTRERADVLEGHRELLRRHGWHYLADRDIFLSHNTDGPGNPLSKVYTRKEARRLFSRFRDVRSHVRYLNLRIYPGGERLARSRLGRSLERRLGWHLVIEATKPS